MACHDEQAPDRQRCRPRPREGQGRRPRPRRGPESPTACSSTSATLEVYFPIQQGFFKSMVSTEKKFVQAVDDISFQVSRARSSPWSASRGCGKTTTGRTLLRLEERHRRPDPLQGPARRSASRRRRCTSTARRRRSSSRTPTTPSTPSRRSSTSSPSRSRSTASAPSEREKEERVIKAISEAGLRPATEYLYRYPHELSGGQRQRVCIAGATVLDPT